MTSTLFDLPAELLRGNTRENRDRVTDWVGMDKKRMARLMDLYLHGEWRLAQLAAGVVCLVAEKHPSMLDPWLPALLKRIQQQDVHDAVRRCGMWTLQVVKIPPRLAGRIAQFSFEMLENVSQPIAMRVYAMTILVRLCKREPDLAREVRTAIETVLPYGTGAFQSRARRELKAVSKIVSRGEKDKEVRAATAASRGERGER